MCKREGIIRDHAHGCFREAVMRFKVGARLGTPCPASGQYVDRTPGTFTDSPWYERFMQARQPVHGDARRGTAGTFAMQSEVTNRVREPYSTTIHAAGMWKHEVGDIG